MLFKPFYLGCLSHASYLLADGGEAAIIDPQRDVQLYLDAAKEAGVTIRWIVETHLHADFVSGHVELARKTGAKILIGHRAGAAFEHVAATHGMEIPIGTSRLRVLETPGHTPEGISLLQLDSSGTPERLFSGDTLFVGDVGRPDLAAGAGFDAPAMASMLYDSLRNVILPLPDAVEVWPAHGAGSSCGKNISNETHSTIGEQRRNNHALQPMSREEFVTSMTTGLAAAPRYFRKDALANRDGAADLDALAIPPAVSPDKVARALAEGVTLLDVRGPDAFAAGHVPGSMAIGLGGQFAPWAGSLVPLDKPVLLVADGDAHVAEARLRLARVGIENVIGFLERGVDGWRSSGRALASLPRVDPASLAGERKQRKPIVLDVRRPGEHETARIPGAVNVPLDRLEAAIDGGTLGIPRDADVVVACASGYRSSSACSLLERKGFGRLTDLTGGTNAWIAAGLPVERRETA